MEVVVLADTHLRAGLQGLPPPAYAALTGADLVLHAGDVVSPRALAELEALAPTRAVLGNNDHELAGTLPAELEIELGGIRVAMIHDSGPRPGRAGRLQRRFPGAQLVIFGHSHIPCDEPGLGGQRLFNPGSPTQRRRQPRPSIGRLRIAGGRVDAHIELL